MTRWIGVLAVLALAVFDVQPEPTSVILGTAQLDGDGAHVGGLTIGLAALGRGDQRVTMAHPSPQATEREVRIARAPGVSEWWRREGHGFEQGVTIDARPAGDGELVLEMSVGDDVRPARETSDRIALSSTDGARIGTYSHLVVRDATGATVPARMDAVADRIALYVDDEGARYPLVVDPLVIAEEATLLATPAFANDGLGARVALSSDGAYAVVTAPTDDLPGGNNEGTARVYLRSGTTWSQQALLASPTPMTLERVGNAVAITGDGTRIVLGGELARDDGGAPNGAAFVFVRSGTTWSFESRLPFSMPPLGLGATPQFGHAVAISDDGLRAYVAESWPADCSTVRTRSIHSYVRAGSVWTETGAAYFADTANCGFGDSLAVSPSGMFVIIGMPDRSLGTPGPGSAIVRRFESGWNMEGPLVATGGASRDQFGTSVAITDTGYAIVGAIQGGTAPAVDSGDATVFVRSGTTWSQQAALRAAGRTSGNDWGAAVAISADGSRALVGGPQVASPTAGADAGRVAVFVRTGTTWSEEGSLVAADAETLDTLGASVALTRDGSLAIAGVPSDNTTAGANAGSARVFTLALAGLGIACTTAGTCASGICVDGVCCSSACAGGTGDCQSCNTTQTGIASGTCAPLSAALAATRTCRASTGVCDPEELCSPTMLTCPPDVLAPATQVCHAGVGGCDAIETCTGTSAACPADLPSPANTICRMAAGGCDVAERCDGVGRICPGDTVLPSGTNCGGGTTGSCSTLGSCNGTSTSCPGTTLFPMGHVCLAANPSNPCDLDDICDGTTDACTPRWAGAATVCGPPVSDVCDAVDHCAGTSGDCVSTFVSGVVCRASTSGCDAAESCSGAGATCPPDGVSPVGTVCRASVGVCDPAESCDGTATSCPADVTSTCDDAGGVDAGASPDGGALTDGGAVTDTGPRADAAAGGDAGEAPPSAGGCGCRAGARSHGAWPLALAMLGLALRRRRRAQDRES